MHILTKNGPEYTIAFHIPVPNTNNLAGVSYRTALVRSGIGGVTSLPDGDGTGGTISAAEKTAIMTTGSVFEVVEVVRFDSDEDGTQLALLQAKFAQIQAREQTRLQDVLAQYGRVVAG